jgi:hypothetical protein
MHGGAVDQNEGGDFNSARRVGDAMSDGGVRMKIGSLALEGLAPGHAGSIGPAVERELAKLVARHGLPPALASAGGAVPGGRFRVSPGASASAAAAQVARQLFDRMRGGR